MKKWISVLLTLCVLGSLCCGCAQEGTSNETDPPSGNLSESGIEETQVPLDIPETRYEDKQLVILSRDDGEWSSVEIFAEDGSSDSISHAVYERNDMLLQKYGVTIAEYKKTSSEHQTAVMNEVSAPFGDFQAVTTSVRVAANMSTNGLLWDLNSDTNLYLDPTKPWWDERMATGMEIDGKLFMVTGDLLTLDNDATFAIMFNKTIAEACKLPDLYDSVLNQEWTMEKSLMHSSGSVVGNPSSVEEGDDMDMVTSMLEALACYSVNTLTKEYYEITVKTKGARDEKSGGMIDLIIGNRVCDLAYYFGWINAVAELQGALLPGSSIGVAFENCRMPKRY